MSTGPLVPMWIGIPLGVAMLVLVAGHLMLVSEVARPASRRRIRLANGGIMLVLIPLLTAGFSLIDPGREARLWVLVWLAALPMLWFVVMLAALDMLNTWRLTRGRRMRLLAERRVLEAVRRAAAREGRGGSAGGSFGGERG